jgi:hypothetical protein
MGRAFVQFMNKASHEVSERVKHIIDHGVEVLKKENPTSADVESVWQEFENLGKDLGSGSAEATTEEMKERLVGHYQARGMSSEDAEKFFEAKWKEILDKAEQIRAGLPQAVKTGKLLWLKIVGGVTAAAAGVALVVTAIVSGTNSGSQINNHVSETDRQVELATMSMQISATRAEFDQLLHDLNAPAIDLPAQAQAQPVQTTVAALPTAPVTAPTAEIRIPLVVASMAQTPVTATVTIPNVPSQTFQTDLGTVYRSMPEARQEIESRISEAPHHEIHGNIDVTAPFGPRVKLSF